MQKRSRERSCKVVICVEFEFGPQTRSRKRSNDAALEAAGSSSPGKCDVGRVSGGKKETTSMGSSKRRGKKTRVCQPPDPVPSEVAVADPHVEPVENDQYFPGLADDLGLMCLARVPRSEFDKLRLINRKFSALTVSRDFFKARRTMNVTEPWIYVVASGQIGWHAFDPTTKRWKRLPILDADYCFHNNDKESFSVGTQLLVVGNAMDGLVTWRYDLVSNDWAKAATMLTPRCLYAWASSGSFAYVAGGITIQGEVLRSAERYSLETEQWETLPDMHECRRLCAGCFMDGKFYVLGGESDAKVPLSCGEVYDPASDTWTLIPRMLPWADSRRFPGAPPLIAVVQNELYILEADSNQLKVYIKSTNSWKALGEVPVRTDLVSGWGVAFKSLGEQLLLIGGARTADNQDGMYVCRPNPEATNLQWEFLTRLCPFGPFVLNCAIVSA